MTTGGDAFGGYGRRGTATEHERCSDGSAPTTVLMATDADAEEEDVKEDTFLGASTKNEPKVYP